MTGPERKRNELKLDFDLEKNAIKKQGRKFNKTEKNFSFFSFITCHNIAIYKCHVFYIKSYQNMDKNLSGLTFLAPSALIAIDKAEI